jgi:large repetitive protein
MTRRLGGTRNKGLTVLACLSLVATMACGAAMTGCGGDDTGGTPPVDGSAEGNASDSSPDVTDAASEADRGGGDADAANVTLDADSGKVTPDADAGNTTLDADAANNPEVGPDADATTSADADAATVADADAATERDADAATDVTDSGHAGDGGDAAVTTYTVGGTLSGLGAGTITLQDNGANSFPLTTNGSFTFTMAIANGATYAVTVSAQPAGQNCLVTNGTGTISGANVTNVTVQCTANTYSIGGTVFGLATDAGPAGLVLQDNGSDTVTVNADGAFSFPQMIASGATYSVTVTTQPAGLHCAVTGGTGTVAAAAVTSVSVNCANDLFTVGGTLTGLSGGSVTLKDNGGNDLVLSSDGTFGFSTPIATGHPYAVTVSANPASPAQTCLVTSGSGTVGSAAITDVSVTCTTNTYLVGGSVNFLASGDQVVLQDNGADNKTIAANGPFEFATRVASGTPYAVTVLTNPSSPISQTCNVTNGAGTAAAADITNVSVVCTLNPFTIGGTVAGLAVGGGNDVVLQDNGGNTTAISANGAFTFSTSVLSGNAYNVTVSGQPTNPPQTCTVSAGAGTVGNGDVTTALVNCSNDFVIGGIVSGLAGGTVILQDDGANNTPISQNGAYTFSTLLVAGSPYAVTVSTQPSGPTQTCVVSNGSGTANANVTNADVVCTTNAYQVGGTVTGLSATESFLIQDTANGNVTIPISANGNFVFPASVPSGHDYNVVVNTNPAGPIFETCSVTNGSGTVVASDVQSIAINCAPTSYTVGGNLTHLAAGASVVLQDNGGDNLTLTANGPFTFGTSVPSGQTYNATVLQNPSGPTQICTATTNSGTVAGSNVTTVAVDCVTQSYKVGGSLTGMDVSGGNTITLQNNLGDNLTLSANGPFQFTTSILSGATYSVTVSTQPPSPAQTCVVTSGSGTVGGGNVIGVVVNCSTDHFTIGGTLTGLDASDEVVLQNNGGDDLLVTASNAAPFTFATTIASGAPYNVTVQQSAGPVSQTCVVTANGSGTVTNAPVTNVAIHCTTNKFHIGGTISGLAAGGTVILTDSTDTTAFSANGAFQFPTTVNSGTAYDVTVAQQPDPTNVPSSPTQQVCTPTVNTGTVGSADVTTVVITCVTTQYTLSVHLTGLLTTSPVSIDLENNGGNDIVATSDSTAAFTTKVDNNSPYAVTIVTQPANTLTQSQICNVGSVNIGTVGSPVMSPTASGTMPASDITVEVRCGRTCDSIHGANPSAGDGLFLIDPDGTGPITQFNAYCLMLFDGGGWTLAESVDNNGIGLFACTQGGVTHGSCSFMPKNTVEALANLSTQVHVRSPVPQGIDPPLEFVESVAGAETQVIQNLRAGLLLNANIDPNNNALQESFWTASSSNTIPGNQPDSISIVSFSCGVGESWPSVYHACGNGFGWHLVDTTSKWKDTANANTALETYVR